MKALVLTEYFKFEYKDVCNPICGGDEVIVQVKASSICGSDVHGYDGQSGRRQPPIVMGHEAAGIISEIGSDVTEFKVGDRVTFDSTVYCGKCYFCRKGMGNLCKSRKVLGVSCDEYTMPGAMAEYIAVKERSLYRVPQDVTFAQAALVEPLSVAVHAVYTSPIKIGDKVVVMGAGTIGLLLTQVIKAAGATEIIVVDLDDAKLEVAKKVGATCAINSKNQDVLETVLAVSDGLGADLVFEAVGIGATLNTAIDVTRLGGNVMMVGNLAQKVDLPLQKCVTRQISLLGCCASAGEYDVCLDLIGHKMVDVDSLISKIAPLENGQEWFDHLHNMKPGLIKVVLEP